MAITFEPEKVLRRMGSKKTVKKLVTRNLTLNQVVVGSLADADILTKGTLEDIALKVIRTYKKRKREEMADGVSDKTATDIAVNGKKLMVQRVQNAAMREISLELKDQYHGEFAEWLPSNAINPDPIHQLNYGKVFQIGRGINGEQPGERFGCQCGMRILVKEDTLSL